jgi:hypothetical protein
MKISVKFQPIQAKRMWVQFSVRHVKLFFSVALVPVHLFVFSFPSCFYRCFVVLSSFIDISLSSCLIGKIKMILRP